MKPNNLKDLLKDGHITHGEVRNIAKGIFDGETTAAGPEGYIITASKFDDLPDHVQGFIIKGILEFTVENVLDAGADELASETASSELNPYADDDDSVDAGALMPVGVEEG